MGVVKAFDQCASYPFNINQSTHSWDSAISKFDLENPRSWVWLKHLINVLPFHLTSIRVPILDIQLFQNLSLKFQGQYHGWGQRSRSYSWHSIQSMNLLFVSQQSYQPFFRYGQQNVWPWKNKLQIWEEKNQQNRIISNRFIQNSMRSEA